MNSKLKIIIIGYGVQGKKRAKIAGNNVVAIVDIMNNEADFKSVLDVPLEQYDAACLCTGDEAKIDIIKFLLDNKKHVLVEKPLLTSNSKDLSYLASLAKNNNVVCYTAYNHRFEPHYIRVAEILKSRELGKIYSIRMFYGNGTARLVKNSLWRDKASGVLADLGSHLLDTLDYWLCDARQLSFKITSAFCHENKSFDHVILSHSSNFIIQLEVSLLSWKNTFSCDIICEKGSVHIDSLCKWGPSTLMLRKRLLPSGKPIEEKVVLEQNDPTWSEEYKYFLYLCNNIKSNTIEKDIWLNNTLMQLAKQVNVKHFL